MSLLNYTKDKLKVAGSGNLLAAGDETNWDFYKKYVERASFSDTVSSPDATLILVGPATYEEIAEISDDVTESDKLTPVGFVTDMTVDDQQGVMRVNEIGSRMPRFAVGDTDTRGRIRRGFFNGSSIAYALYRNSLKNTSARDKDKLYDPPLQAGNSGDDFYKFGLWSDMFKVPFGMAVCMRSYGNDFLASFYLEQIYFESYNKAIARDQVLIFEDVSWVCERIRTVKIKITGSSIGNTLKDEGSMAKGKASEDNAYPHD